MLGEVQRVGGFSPSLKLFRPVNMFVMLLLLLLLLGSTPFSCVG
jgi:hypothetical protein